MAADLLATAATASFLVRQATTAAAFTRAQLGYTDRSRLFSRLKPGHHVLEIGPGEGVCHRHFPPGLVYTALDPSLPMTAKRLSVSQQRNVPPPRVFRTALPVERSCASFSVVSGFWQVEMPRLVAQSKRFDAVLVTLPSTIYFGPDDRVGGSDGANEEGHLKGSALLRSALRIPRPRAEWGRFAADVSHLLKPGGVLLVAEPERLTLMGSTARIALRTVGASTLVTEPPHCCGILRDRGRLRASALVARTRGLLVRPAITPSAMVQSNTSFVWAYYS